MTDEDKKRLLTIVEILAGIAAVFGVIFTAIEHNKKMIGYDLTNQKTALEIAALQKTATAPPLAAASIQ